MTGTTYEGWTNKPTWLVNLWWDNDEHLANVRKPQMRARVWQAATGGTFLTREEEAVQELAAAIQYAVEENEGLCEWPFLGFASDMMQWALGQVNYREIATNWLGDLSEADRAEIDA